MSTLRKRFWKRVDLQKQSDGMYAPLLDGRPIILPQGTMLSVESHPLAKEIVREWEQIEIGAVFSPDTLPLTRISGTYIERVKPDLQGTRHALFAYGLDDVLCYRSPAQDDALLGKVLAWAHAQGLSPRATYGVMPLQQPKDYQEALERYLKTLDAASLAALGVIVPVYSSLLLGLALLNRVITLDEAMCLGHADEKEQLRRWGHDDELADQLKRSERDVGDAIQFLSLFRKPVA